MNILIINISLRPKSEVLLFPVGLGYIATTISKAGYDFDLLDIDAWRYSDSEVDEFIGKKEYDVICLGSIVTGYSWIKDLTRRIRNIHNECIIIAGNTVASSIPEIILRNTEVNIAVLGEGDITIIDLLKNIENKKALDQVEGIALLKNNLFIETPQRPMIKNMDDLHWIDFDLFDVEKYIENSPKKFSENHLIHDRESLRGLPINTARGCVARCTFCYHAFKGYPYRFRSGESIASEAEFLAKKYNLNIIGLSDELTFHTKKRALEFAEGFENISVKLAWGGNIRAGLFTKDEDVELLLRMKEAGCVGLSYSLESADADILKAMNKHISLDDFTRQTEIIRKADIPVYTSLVFGFPQETPETIRKTFDICIENKIYPSIGYLLPQPGSVMYDYAIQNGYIPDEEEYIYGMNDRQDLYLNMTKMSNEEFIENVLEGAQRCNKMLNTGLDDETLIKTTRYRIAKDDKESK